MKEIIEEWSISSLRGANESPKNKIQMNTIEKFDSDSKIGLMNYTSEDQKEESKHELPPFEESNSHHR